MPALVERVTASRTARERVKVMLLTLAGQWSVSEGCERLGIGRTRFQDLRRRFLRAGADALEGGVAGRPRGPGSASSGHGSVLREEVSRLRHRLQVVRTQVDIFDSGLGEAPRVRAALHAAHISGGSIR